MFRPTIRHMTRRVTICKIIDAISRFKLLCIQITQKNIYKINKINKKDKNK